MSEVVVGGGLLMGEEKGDEGRKEGRKEAGQAVDGILRDDVIPASLGNPRKSSELGPPREKDTLAVFVTQPRAASRALNLLLGSALRELLRLCERRRTRRKAVTTAYCTRYSELRSWSKAQSTKLITALSAKRRSHEEVLVPVLETISCHCYY